MEEKPSYFAVLPAEVRYDKKLKDKAKLLYGEITSLSNKNGYCYANNKYFAELYNVSVRTITELIKNLVDKNYIQSEIIYEKNTKKVVERRLYLLKNISIPIEENFYTPLEENFYDNNTSNNNIKENKKEKKKYIGFVECNEMVDTSELSEKSKRSIKEWFEYKTQKGEHYTEIGFKKLITQINNYIDIYGEDNIIDLIDTCIVRNYKGIIINILKEQPKKVERQEKDFHYVN